MVLLADRMFMKDLSIYQIMREQTSNNERLKRIIMIKCEVIVLNANIKQWKMHDTTNWHILRININTISV